MEGKSCCDLVVFWTKFNEVEDNSLKEKWLELFLFAFNKLSESTNSEHLHKHCSISSSAASKLTSYALKYLYGIICSSLKEKKDDESCLNIPNESKKSNGTDEGESKTLRSDLTTIVALRECLIHGIGGRILASFQSLDTKKIMCAREFTGLLVNLFPSQPWEFIHTEFKTKCEVDDVKMLQTVLESFEDLKLPKSRRINLETSSNDSSKIQCSISHSEEELHYDGITKDPELYYSKEFVEWKSTNFSCDYVASIILNVLVKLSSEENMLSVDKKSVCVQALDFSVGCYCSIERNGAFKSENKEKLRSKALTLILLCIHNIMRNTKRFEEHFDILQVFEKLYGSIASNVETLTPIQAEHETGLIYFSCLLMHKLRKHPSETGEKLFRVLASRIDCILNILQIYYEFTPTENSENLSKLIHVLCKTIFEIRNHDLGNKVKLKKKNKKKQRKKLKRYACSHHHQNTSEYGCVLENLLLQIMQFASTENLSIIFQFFQRNTVCCCNTNLKIIDKIITNAKSKWMHKSALNFVKNNFLKFFYENVECAVCESRKTTSNYEAEFVCLYKVWFEQLHLTETVTFLKHIAKISKYLSFEVSFQFFVDIVLPPFRVEKIRYIDSATRTPMGQEIIESCLNIFLCFLKDIRLIKGFFNGENVQHMEDLIVYPEFASLTCCLLKVGMENLSFLGENASEQSVMSEMLHNLQSTAIRNISIHLAKLFRGIERDRHIGLRINENNVAQKTLDIYNESIILSSLKNLLHLGVVYWNLILQLLRTNEQFKNVVYETIAIDPCDLQNIVLNSFSCYLNSKQFSGGSGFSNKLIKDVEDWLLTNGYKNDNNGESDLIDSNDCDINICDFLLLTDKQKGIFDIQYDIEYEKIINFFYVNGATVNYGSQTNFTNKNLFIENAILNTCDSVKDIKKTVQSEYLIVTGVKKIKQFLTNTVFDHFFVNSEVNSSIDKPSSVDLNESESETDYSNVIKDYETVECSSLFLQLFEITAGVMVLANWEHPSSVSAIRELKILLLDYSYTTTGTSEEGSKLIGALQSLLKVAEMKFQCCFIANCHHSSVPAQPQQNIVNTNENNEAYCCPSSSRLNDDEIFSSDIECSDKESSSSEVYTTADEGYDGDAELVQNDSDSRNRYSSRYGSHVVHEGLCRVVIDILIELSKRCLKDPSFWPKYLVQIATRLGTIRESIGGSLYLIRGFSKILSCNDLRLRELQKAILELITDISSPETLSAYLNILSGDNPPIDLLLPRLVYLGSKGYSVQPSFALQFPSVNDESINTTCDPQIFRDIKQIYDYHELHKLKTAFSQSTYIIPLNGLNFSPWSQEGFTITTWIQLKSLNSQQKTKSSSSDDENPFQEPSPEKPKKEVKYEKVHLMSVGSNKLLFSVYVSSNDNSTFYLQLSKPNAHHIEKKIPKLTRSSTEIIPDPPPVRKRSPCVCSSLQRRRKSYKAISPIRNETTNEQQQIEYVKMHNAKVGDESLGLNVLSSTYHAVRSTHIAIRNSLSQFNLFSSTPNDQHYTSQVPMEVKGLTLSNRKWSHLSFSVMSTGSEIRVRITIDGATQRDVNIPCSEHIKNDKFEILCVGAKSISPKLVEHTSPTKSNQPDLMYNLSNVKLFRKCILEADVLGSLVALGADCVSLTQCQIGNALPNFGFLNTMSNVSGEIDFTRSVKNLKDNLIAVFSSSNPKVITGFSNRFESVNSGDVLNMVTFGRGANCVSLPSFQSATLLCGGMSTLLFLFAKVVELSTSEFIQSLALTFILKIAHSNSNLYTEFIKKDCNSLIGPVIRSSRCIKGINLLNAILETAYDKPILTRRSDGFRVVPNTHANIVHCNLLMSIIQRYSDWYVPKCNDSNILDILLETIQALVREKHPRQQQNIQILNKADLIPALLNFCKIHLVGVPEPVYLSRQAAESIVNLISVFAGSPPSSLLLDDIIKVLLLLHRPSESFITHDRSKFYFLISSMVMVKQKRISLPITSRKLSINIRRERKNAVPIRNFKNPTTQNLRSISLDHTIDNKYDQISSMSSEGQGSIAKESKSETTTETASQTLRPEYPSSSQPMDDIVSYSSTDRRMKNLLNTGQSSNTLLNIQLKKRTFNKKKITRKTHSNVSSRSRTTTDSETERESKAKGSVSESGIEEDMSLVREYEIIGIDDVRKMEEKLKFKFQRQEKTFENTQHGITQLQSGFFNLLRDFILILPDASIQEVLSHYVTVDIILIMANHQDTGVRTSIVKLLTIISSRLNENVYNSSMKSYHWYHLANQIALHKADLNLVTSIAQWVTVSCLSIDQMIVEDAIGIREKCGVNSLIAILPQCIHDLNLTKTIFTFMDKLYSSETTNMRRYMIDVGIVPSLIKSLTKFFLTWGTTNAKIVNTIQELMMTISYKSLSSNGNISIVWDLLNGLSFMEESKTSMIQRSIRSTQAVILYKLLHSFLPPDKSPFSSKFKFNASDINLSNCLLSLSEKKIRFELLLNRIVQFITHMESSYIQTDEEIKLIELVVILSVCGCAHGNSIIGWGLCPSRPLPLKVFIIKQLWLRSRANVLPTLACDGKIIKTMTHSFMITDKDILLPEDSEILTSVCSAMGISSSTTLNVSHTLEKIEFMRQSSIKDQNPSIERTVFKFESIVQQCIDSAMKITRDVVEIQNMERRILMNEMRAYDESGLSHEWNIIIDRMTHEGAPWYNAEMYPNSWEMDQTEGPFRTRIRLKRCHLNIDKKFLISHNPEDNKPNSSVPLEYLSKSLVQRPHYSLSDQVIYTFPCKHLPVDTEVDGEIVVTESNIIFLANNLEKDPIIIDVAHVSEVWLRRYQHQEIGMEFFLETNKSKFFIFADTKDREIIKNYFADKVVQCPGAYKLAIVTQQWKERQITNWEYLIALNQISGRTFQDLMQYPVFPWILADYKSPTLDLKNLKSFRNFEKPIAVQHPENEAHYINNYNYLEQTQMTSSAAGYNQLLPYHYGSHYSNSGTVLHFMVRVPPFTQFFLHYQDNNFDLPDRTFHSISTTWRLASKESPTDVKELIPEFFCFPEMFENFESLNFGIRQSGESVYDVILPPWANQSSRLFVLIHRQALECDLVRQNLHKWIDLVFGYKQMGQEAINAINVFHPATYIGFSMSGVSDPVEKIALETMVRTYGQMPRQLLTTPHPESSIAKLPQPQIKLRSKLQVKGLRWGIFTGSPELSEPMMMRFFQQYDMLFSSLVALVDTNVLYCLPNGCNMMQGNESDTINLISWNDTDGIIGIRPLCDENTAVKPLIREFNFDQVSCCGTDPKSNQLWLGHKSGRISVYQCLSTSHSKLNKSRVLNSTFNKLSYNSAFRKISSKEIGSLSESQNMSSKWKDVVVLIKHTDEVMQICISNEFKVVVTVAKDGLAAIWDLNKLQFIRSIERPSICKAPIYLGAVSPTLGDIVTIHILDPDTSPNSDENLPTTSECLEATENIDEDFVNVPIEVDGKSLMRLHTINAKYITHISIPEEIKCVSYSFIKEGTGINVIATGFDGGIVRLWSSWDLMLVKEIKVGDTNVISLCYSTYQHLIVLTSDNIIQVWESSGLPGNQPKFPQLYQKKN